VNGVTVIARSFMKSCQRMRKRISRIWQTGIGDQLSGSRKRGWQRWASSHEPEGACLRVKTSGSAALFRMLLAAVREPARSTASESAGIRISRMSEEDEQGAALLEVTVIPP
jgi:hypothetical protein